MKTSVAALLMCFGVAQAGSDLTIEGPLPDGPSFSAYLVSYQSDGLKVHAMVAVPISKRPESGFPIVVANHGYVPDPRQYGIGADGSNSRPGDYYRSVPELYASRGFVVVMPDYRGHNNSEGYERIKGQAREAMQEIVRQYAKDVASLLPLLAQIEGTDIERVYMWSHSMGGGVAMHVLTNTELVKAASFWATMRLDSVDVDLSNLNCPVIIQHAQRDSSTPYTASEDLAMQLRLIDRQYELHSYDSSDHYFEGELRERAADRDATFFKSTLE